MRRLHFLVMACALATGGCILPCSGGACNAKGPLWVPPLPRFGECERLTAIECSPKPACPIGYPTFAKYWPGLDEWSTNHTAKSAARSVLFRQQLRTLRFYNADYKDGFQQAYIDIANGGSGECPPVPPPRYWNTFYRSSCGEKYAERWFDGYRAGAAMANIELGKLRTVHASYDWQMPERGKFAGADHCIPNNGCQSGQCDPRVGAPTPPNFVCRPGMGMMGDSPQVPVGPGMMPQMPYVPPTQGFDPTMMAPNQPLPNYGMAPGYGPPSNGPQPAPNAVQNSGPIAPQPGAIGPGYSTPSRAPQGVAPGFSPGPGYSNSSPSSGAGPQPRFGPPQSQLLPGYSSGGEGGAPSSLPAEPLVIESYIEANEPLPLN